MRFRADQPPMCPICPGGGPAAKAVQEVKRTVDHIEHEIKAVDVVLQIMRFDGSVAETLEAKLEVQKHIRYLEAHRARLRRELFAAMDEAGL
jgi:hypothetical protein